MISDGITAKQVSDLMQEMFRQLDESVTAVKATCPPEEAVAYGKAVGRVVGPIVMDVMAPLYERHPELKPSNWDDDD
jgi:hypothetical protein